MKKSNLLLGLVCVVSIWTAAGAVAEPISITADHEQFVVANGIHATPDSKGFILSREVVLPAFDAGAYYRPYSDGAPRGNRVEAVAFSSVADLQSYQPSATRKGHGSVQQGQFILLKISETNYLAMLPMVSSEVYSQFFMEAERLVLKSGSFGTEPVKGDLPLLIWAYGASPYEATRSVWKRVIESKQVATDWRSNKPFPEMYDYLGWCSWEFYKKNISEQIITNAVHILETCGAPIRWVMVDDGYLTHKKNKIVSFTPDRKKFPNGWSSITDLKKPDQIKWMGVWRHTMGYMGGIFPQNTMNDIKKYLVPAARGGSVLPDGSPEAAKAFYDKMVLDSKESGFDFTKVDFQTKAFDLYFGKDNAVRAMRANNEALENACKNYQIPLLNCIAQPNVNSLQTKYSVLTRSSPDYNQTDKAKNKCNTYQSFANHLWMGQTVWGDLDMFHSHDERDAESMAIARAISGGPVYISDEPGKVVPPVLTPFCLNDGKLLRTAAPATLLPESFFIHPFRDGKPFRVIAPLEDRVAAIALFNFTEGGKSISSSFSAADYPYAGEQLQPAEAWVQPEEGLLVYDRDRKKVIPMVGNFAADIGNFAAKLFLLYPKTHGWAVIGRSDKYLPSAAVKIKSVSSENISFTMKESGPLMVWSEKGAPHMEGATFKSIGDNLFLADLPVTTGAKEVTLTR